MPVNPERKDRDAMNGKLDLSKENISRPVPLDVELPAGAQIQEICVSGHYVVLDQESGIAYSTDMVAKILEHMLAGGTSHVKDEDLACWLVKTRAAKHLHHCARSALTLSDQEAAMSMANILRHPEHYD